MHDDKFTKGMRGEFRGDFTRDTFDPLRQFSRVLMQQGRVQLDADWNEQVSILVHYLRMLGADLMGPHGAPRTVDGVPGEGFKIIANGSTFEIASGHYYVNGILCENNENVAYHTQTDFPLTDDEEIKLDDGTYLVYLDVWERHLSYVEDDYMREKALGGLDTATRARIVWQVKVKNHDNFPEGEDIDPTKFKSEYSMFLRALEKKPGSGLLKARARKTPEGNKDPCLTSPEASYRGAENQLYRVEIHEDGYANRATFKWSRENGSVIFPIMDINGTVVTLEHLGRDSRFGLKPNDWIEIVDDDYILRNRADALLQIEEIDPDNLQVILKKAPEPPFEANREKHPYLRRWDQKDNDSNGVSNGISVVEGDTEQDWILLEDGVEIQFPTPEDGNNSYVYQTGDYWLIPARTATGDVEWPGPVDAPHALPPQGVEHHYAPLRNITVDNSGNVAVVGDLRRKLKKNWD
jgi:hypothetical protein